MNGGSSSIVPLKPVDIRDKYGLKAGIYAVNAARKRSGQPELAEETIAPIVQNKIINADWEKLCFLLNQWHGSKLEAGKEEIIKMFKENDMSRYEHGMVINDIELGALATEFNICIAVKAISSTDGESSPGWRIAVPAPSVFGKSSQSQESSGDPSCVFLVCQKISEQRRFIVLIPQNQPVFAPGRLLVLPDKAVAKNEQLTTGSINIKKEIHDVKKVNSVEDSSFNKENKDLERIAKIAESAGDGKEFVPLPINGRIELRIADLNEATILFQRVYGPPGVEIVG